MQSYNDDPSSAILLFSNSEDDAEQYYFSGFFVPDPFIAFAFEGKAYAVLSVLEYDRAIKESHFDEILLLEEVKEEARKVLDKKYPSVADWLTLLANKMGIRRFVVSYRFPAGLALALKEMGFDVTIAEDGLFPGRLRKRPEERAAIREANRACEAALARAFAMLEASTIENGMLYYQGELLTSERVRFQMDVVCLERGAVARHTIVASGVQGCDPHCSGSGPIRAGELIIVDVFPRDAKSGYFGDMTRTFLKGRPGEAQKALVETVMATQAEAVKRVKRGLPVNELHAYVKERFDRAGYLTEKRDGRNVGFIHSTGHGLGLEIHEGPRVGPADGVFEPGMVVTIEPGLYYPGVGGCRIEDVVAVTEGEPERLSDFSYRWQID